MEFFKVQAGIHTDHRRRIFDIVLPEMEIPFSVRQVKIVDVYSAGMVVGNHYHTKESGRQELFGIVSGEFTLRLRYGRDAEITERIMKPGDACLIRPEVSHAFRADQPGQIIGLSNLAYDSAHDVPDQLF